MKNIVTVIVLFFSMVSFAQTGIGTTSPNASAQLDVSSTTKGFLPPRMTEAQRTAISNPVAGLLVYQNNNTTGYYFYTGTEWVSLHAGTVAIANGGTGATAKGAAFNALSPMSAGGDIIYGGSGGAGTRLEKGEAGQVLTMNAGATAPEWKSATAPGHDIHAFGNSLTISTQDNFSLYLFVGVQTEALLTLPSVSENSGKELIVKNLNSFNAALTISTSGGDQIANGGDNYSTTFNLPADPSNSWVRFISDGFYWIAFK